MKKKLLRISGLTLLFILTLQTCDNKTLQNKEEVTIVNIEEVAVNQSYSFSNPEKGDPEEFSSNFIINDNKRWQLIASSQNYSSNYAIYAKFKTSKTENNEKIIINEAKFTLINYKNLIYLGIEDVRLELDDESLYVAIHIKANGKYYRDNPEKNKALIIDNINIKINKNSKLNSERILLPMHIIDESTANGAKYPIFKKKYKFSKKYSRVENENQDSTMIYAKNTDNRIFDTEFFYKDGIYSETKKDYDDDDLIIKFLAPGLRCKTATFYLLYKD